MAGLGTAIEPHETRDTSFRTVIPGSVLTADPDLKDLVLTPGSEQWLGPDHHIIGYGGDNNSPFFLHCIRFC